MFPPRVPHCTNVLWFDLGSASLDLLRQSESLAGRIACIEMEPFNVLEITHAETDSDMLWLRGGFPESYLARDDRESLAWRKDFIRAYLERDVPLFGPRVPRRPWSGSGRCWPTTRLP